MIISEGIIPEQNEDEALFKPCLTTGFSSAKSC